MAMLTTEQASALAARHWGIQGEARALPSYADQNFRIRADGDGYVLKIAHSAWSAPDIELENLAMMELAAREPSLGCPRVQFATSGQHLLELPMDGQTGLVRMLSYVPGTTYAEAINELQPR